MFDSVMVTCDVCGQRVEFQSKAGDQTLREYSLDDVPDEIANDLDGCVEACSCGRVITLETKTVTRKVLKVMDLGE